MITPTYCGLACLVVFFGYYQLSPITIPNTPGSAAVSETGSDPTVSFRGDIVPLFQTKCNQGECHGPKGTAFPKFTSHPMIKSKAKKIITRLEDKKDPMPPADAEPRITAQEIQLFKTWVAEGFPEN